MTKQGEPLAKGSGFLWRGKDGVQLVTAAHNLTGVHPTTGKHLSLAGAIPDGLLVEVASIRSRQDNVSTVGWVSTEIPLQDNAGNTLWRVHPKRPAVDIASVPVPAGTELDWHVAVNDDLSEYEDFRVTASMDAFVVGFPEGLDGGGSTPLWKKATIASEPAIAIQKSAPLLIDTATRQGMSGSPVFVKDSGIITPTRLEGQLVEGQMHPETIIGTAFAFLGCYTARPLPDESGTLAQLGTVFLQNQIEELVESGVKPNSSQS